MRPTLLLLAGCSFGQGDKGTDPEGSEGSSEPPSVSFVAPVDGEVHLESAGVSVGVFASDPDDDPADLTLRWTSSIDGDVAGPSEVSADGTAVGTLTLSPGEHVLTVQVEDPAGNPAMDAVGVSVDAAPIAPTVVISPDPALTSDDLLAGVLDLSLDPEGGAVDLRYAWSRDGADAGLTTDLVGADSTTRGETWSVQVWASDGRQEGPPGTASVLVGPSCDQDGDGALDDDPECGGDDCDDLDAAAFPGNVEVWYDGVDGDCDGADDDDADGDGVPADEDCDDGDATASPDETEDCFDGVDNDCDGTVDSCTELAADAPVVIAGDQGESMGTGLPAGDVDGDGVEDVWVGGMFADASPTPRGAAYLHLGPLTGTLVADEGVATVRGAASFDHVGRVIAPAGDLDSDGYDDVWHGAFGYDTACATSRCPDGEAWLFHGPLSGSLGVADASHRISATDTIDYAGSGLVALGDADGDGVPDLGVVGWSHLAGGTSSRGALWLISGPVSATDSLHDADATILGDRNNERFGWINGAVDAGDTDGDGLDEVWVGAHYGGFNGSDPGSAEGAAYLIRGIPGDGTASSVADFVVTGDAGGDWLGYGVGAPGDLDDDGYDDLLVTAPNGGTQGEVYVIHGPASVSGTASGVAAAVLQSTADLGVTGLGLAAAGDVDGDGDADLWIGLDQASADVEGAAVLMTGPFSGSRSLGAAAVRLDGSDRADRVGFRLASGDLDGDGSLDVLVAAPGADPLGVGGSPGAISIWPGSGF
jgi:hypothetical protein